MSNDVIIVENLAKAYLIGHRQADGGFYKYTALRDVLARSARNVLRKSADMLRGRPVVQGDQIEEFWALKDINFDVKRGEVFGIVGRNGAGKSTLLKILSRITEPTKGRITLQGRVASLLEVGTGFHPELTGRENIFLNGAILGMTQREIRKKFDEIVAFAEIEKFLDTPVKHFSSGMYVRLAFAVAAHLEPEILIVDEILAVGDAEFQKKCLGKMSEVSQSHERTVLFVSHNMESVLKLCNRAMFIESGAVKIVGDSQSVVSAYLNSHSSSCKVINLSENTRTFDFARRISLVKVCPSEADDSWSIPFGKALSLDLSLATKMKLESFEVIVSIHSARGFEISSWTSRASSVPLSATSGETTVRITFDNLRLLPGQYSLGFSLLSDRGYEDSLQDAVQFEIVPSTEAAQINAKNLGGVIVPHASVVQLSG